jgi:hypothetical protein
MTSLVPSWARSAVSCSFESSRLPTRRAPSGAFGRTKSNRLDGGDDGARVAADFSRDLLGAVRFDDPVLNHQHPLVQLGNVAAGESSLSVKGDGLAAMVR